MNEGDKVIAGSEARYILEHKQFRDAFTAVRQSIISQMQDVKPRDTDMHSELIRRLQTLDAVERALRKVIATGDLAKAEIERERTLAEHARERLNRVFSRN